jgi:outer membrane protein insertion porin family
VAAITKSKENIYNTGLYDIVRIGVDSLTSTDDTLRLIVSVIEKKQRWFGLRGGFVTDPSNDMQANLTGEWGDKNVLGTGSSVSFRAISAFELFNNWANNKNRFEADYTEPWSFAKRIPVTVNLYYEPYNSSETGTDFLSVRQYGGQLSGVHRPKRTIKHIVSLSYTQIDVKAEEGAPTDYDYFSTKKSSPVERKIGYSFERDSRDNLLFPKTGTQFAASTQLAGLLLGGDQHFTRTEMTWARFRHLPKGVIYAFRLKSGYIRGLKDGTMVAAYDRFYIGGSNSIRGFKEKSLGPSFNTITVDSSGIADTVKAFSGGNFYSLSNFELRIPVVWRIYCQLFADIGGLWQDEKHLRSDEIAVSTGWGISVSTPFGPIRFDYGYVLKDAGTKQNKNWHLSILYAF